MYQTASNTIPAPLNGFTGSAQKRVDNPNREGEVIQACGELASQIDLLETHLSTLIQRLTPVSHVSPAAASDSEKTAGIRYSAPIASSIDSQRQRLNTLVCLIEEACDRLELP